jgi:hypothetical protein
MLSRIFRKICDLFIIFIVPMLRSGNASREAMRPAPLAGATQDSFPLRSVGTIMVGSDEKPILAVPEGDGILEFPLI